MPSSVKIKYNEIKKCKEGEDYCLCITCSRLCLINSTEECGKKRCYLKQGRLGRYSRVCHSSVQQCSQYSKNELSGIGVYKGTYVNIVLSRLMLEEDD